MEPDTREWLSTNGLGGYASGTVCGANTRRYHGLLVAALSPPAERLVLLSRLDETVIASGERLELSTNFWASGAIEPRGDLLLAGFSRDPVPTWEYRVGLGRLIKRVSAVPGRNAVAISYRLEGGPPVRLELRLLANQRDFHGETRGHPDWHFQQDVRPDGLDIAGWDGAPGWSLRWSGEPDYRPLGLWYWGYHFPEEAARGLPAHEDLYCLGELGCRLRTGDSLDLIGSLEPEAPIPMDELVEELELRQERQLEQSGLPRSSETAALVAAADQFIVQRASTDGPSVIAGYHWFGDWCRDAMISLPGLLLTTRRFDEAAGVLRTFAQYLDRGMLPNRFPDYPGEPLPFNGVDATLWWFQALARYTDASGDPALLAEQLPLLAEVVEWHLRGTRHGIRVDPADGLLAAGEPGLQLTWMDARVGDWVVTPRLGKPIEVNALWLGALEMLAEYAPRVGENGRPYRELADQARAGLAAFWLADRGYLADVLEPDGRPDASLRPNQLVALALPNPAFSRDQAARVLAAVDAALLTPYGLRTLAPDDPRYRATYDGDAASRDGAYHQGAVWPWLLGPYADACRYAHGPAGCADRLRELVRPLLRHLQDEACLGSVSEIFEPAPPYTPRGCVAQAWSVAELLRISALLDAGAGPANGRL